MMKTIGIIGFGRFGQVIHRLFDDGFDLLVSSSRIEEGVVDGVVFAPLQTVVESSDALFLTVPIGKTEETGKRILPYLRPGQVVIDVCSVKEMPNQALKQLFEGMEVTVWPTHPMFGPDSTQGGFNGLVWVTCEDELDPRTIAPYTDYIESKGLTLVRTTCAEHDRMAARSQGLTHFIGRFLDELRIEPTSIDTVGYKRLMAVRDQTCNDTWELFCDLQYFNRFSGDIHQGLLDAVFCVLSRFLDTVPKRETCLVGVQKEAPSDIDGMLRDMCPKNRGYELMPFDTIEGILSHLFLGRIDFGLFHITACGELDEGAINALGAYTFQSTRLFKDDAGETFMMVERRKWQQNQIDQ